MLDVEKRQTKSKIYLKTLKNKKNPYKCFSSQSMRINKTYVNLNSSISVIRLSNFSTAWSKHRNG